MTGDLIHSRPRGGRPTLHDEDVMLDAAARALLKRGYSQLRYSDVSEECGVPVPSLQHRFLTLDRLRRAALCRKVRLELEELVETLAPVQDPWEWVVAMIDRSVTYDPEARQSDWTLWLEYLHAAAHDEALAADYDQVDHIWLSALHEVISRGAAQGRFCPQMSTWDATRALQGLIDGLGAPLAMARTDCYVDDVIRLLTDCAEKLLRPQPL